MKYRAPRRVVLSVAVLGTLLVAGCGRASAPRPVDVGAPLAPAAGGEPTLPTLPPISQRAPDQFDPNGCLRTPVAPSACSSTAGQIDAEAARAAPDGTRTLAGFIGRYWSTDPPSGAVTVIEGSVTTATSPEGRWTAVGLVRNEQAGVIAGATVTAELVAADGNALGSVSGDALIRSLRPGEPAPFSLSSSVPAGAAVASVRWTASASSGVADPGARSIELQTFWVRVPSDPRRVDNEVFRDPPAGPVPLLVSGSITNRGAATIAKPRVVAAWLDGGGRVAVVRDVAAVASTGEPAASIDPALARDFLVDVDAPAVASVTPDQLRTPMLWSAGS